MFKVIQSSKNTSEIIADLISDIETLPNHYGVGSTCFVIENSSVYMLGNDKQWHSLNFEG